MRAMLAERLRTQGLDVIEAASGTELFGYVGAASTDPPSVAVPDLVVTDVHMPGFSGLEVLELVREAGWTMPAIIITAFSDEATRAEAHRLGAAAVFDKPFELGDLVAAALRLAASFSARSAPAGARSAPAASPPSVPIVHGAGDRSSRAGSPPRSRP
jgi:DNA-binding response OmpR family regulator